MQKKYDREMQFITRTARACNAGIKITKMLCERKHNQVGMQFLNKNEKNKWSGYDLHQSRPWEEKRAVGWFQ